MSGKGEKNENLRDVERDFQEEKKNESIEDQSRKPDQQNRLKDQENLRK
ncbi:MAG: hypothetical protein ACQEUT_09075 [Bacillota bacterium]